MHRRDVGATSHILWDESTINIKGIVIHWAQHGCHESILRLDSIAPQIYFHQIANANSVHHFLLLRQKALRVPLINVKFSFVTFFCNGVWVATDLPIYWVVGGGTHAWKVVNFTFHTRMGHTNNHTHVGNKIMSKLPTWLPQDLRFFF